MGIELKKLLVGAFAVALGACAAAPRPPGEPDSALARTMHESAVRASLARPGIHACRQLMVGIAERDWLRGDIVDASRSLIGVRIRDAGRFPHFVDNTFVQPGTVLWAAPAAWTPCV